MATVNRVLPWRRNVAPQAEEVAPLVELFRARHPRASTSLITRAYERAHDAHAGQSRKSGEPYITHPLAVAMLVADLGLDDVTIAAALLHDAVEDTGVSLADLEGEFGPDVAAIVDGVTKLERVKFDSKEAQQAASVRKMLVAMAKDLRVLIIKLCDRLHNLRTIAAMPAWKQELSLIHISRVPRGPGRATRGPPAGSGRPRPMRRPPSCCRTSRCRGPAARRWAPHRPRPSASRRWAAGCSPGSARHPRPGRTGTAASGRAPSATPPPAPRRRSTSTHRR